MKTIIQAETCEIMYDIIDDVFYAADYVTSEIRKYNSLRDAAEWLGIENEFQND